MQKPTDDNGLPANNQPLPGQLVLLGLGKDEAPWHAATDACGILCQSARTVDACASYTASDTPTLVVAAESAFEPKLASEIHPFFRRSVLLVVCEAAERVPLWQWIAWDARVNDTPESELSAIISEGLDESRSRAAEWALFDAFVERRALLSPEEELVFQAVCKGRLNKQIAADLGVSIRTIEQRRSRLFDKMRVESAVPLAAMTAAAQALESRIAREQRHEDRLMPLGPTIEALQTPKPNVPKHPTPKPKFSGSFLTGENHNAAPLS